MYRNRGKHFLCFPTIRIKSVATNYGILSIILCKKVCMKEKILYLTTWDFSDGPSYGITQKIKAQIKAFKEYGYEVDYTYISYGKVFLCKGEKEISLGNVGKLRKFEANYHLYKKMGDEEYTCIYNRYGLMDPCYFLLLKRFSDEGSKIVVEVPTYPYRQERLPGLSWWALYFIDSLYLNKIKKCVDGIATYSLDEEIWGIKTIKIHNGVDFSNIACRIPENNTDEIRLLAVAGLAKWHGYDRLFRGMGEYYKKEQKRKIVMHVVGDGPPMEEYRRIIDEYGIAQYCIFHGVKRGKELDPIYNMCDIGVECLANFRKSIFLSSSLKSREYAAKGLPFIMAGKSDVFENKEFVLKVQEDETAVRIDDIVNFYDRMYNGKDKLEIAKIIRKQSEEYCAINNTMKPIIDFFETGKSR